MEGDQITPLFCVIIFGNCFGVTGATVVTETGFPVEMPKRPLVLTAISNWALLP